MFKGTRGLVLVLVMGALVGVSSTFAWTQINRPKERLTLEQVRRNLGAHYSYSAVEQFDMSVGLDAGGRHVTPVPQEEVRHHFNIPKHYGELMHISDIGHDSVLWFRGEDGLIRNVALRDVDQNLLRIECFDSFRYETKWIRP